MIDASNMALIYIAVGVLGLLGDNVVGAWACMVIANLWWIEGRRGRK